MRTALMATMLMAATACGTKGDTTDEYNGPYCEETTTSVSLDEVTDLGHSAQDLLDLAVGEHLETMTWADDGDVGLTMTVSSDATEASYITGEAVYPDTGEVPTIAAVCPPRLEVAIDVDFVTDDGSLDESFAATLVQDDTGLLDPELFEELDETSLTGTFDAESWVDVDDEEELDDVGMAIESHFADLGTRGTVYVTAEGSEKDCADGDGCTAWAMSLNVLDWDSTGDSE